MPHYEHVLTTQQNVRASNQGIRAKDESMVTYKQNKNALTYAGINLTGYHPPPGHPGAFSPKCVPSPGAFAQQKVPGGRANK